MRPLNRPMFRNGGPIKEGIMSGMQDRPGYSLAGRVGGFFQNVFKKKPVQTGTVVANKKGSVVGEGFKKIKELFTGTPTTTVKSVDNLKTKPSLSQSKIPGAEGSVSPVSFNTQTTYNTLPVGMSLSNKNLYAAAQNVLTPTTKLVAGTAKALKPYSGVITIGGIGAYSLFNDDGTPKDIAQIEANRQRYYKLMGIDKMNKDAVYNSLIDASNQIREGGNIKDQLKSGDLVGGVINALSKNLDKSVDLKKQIDAAILKGEITKDINREKDQLDAEYKRMAITKTKSDMAGGTLNQIINDRKSKGMVTSGQDLFKLAVQTGNASNIKEIISDKAVSNYFKDNPTSTAADFFQEKVIAPAIEKGQSITPGDYIVGENILRVSADGSIQFVF
jgi:translation initiation factor 2 beta subunit (eIF-2beta)/eIF-5